MTAMASDRYDVICLGEVLVEVDPNYRPRLTGAAAAAELLVELARALG